MEEEKRKKKNKKKKGKQTTTTESVAVSRKDTTPLEQNHAAANGQNNHLQISGNANVQTAGVSEIDSNLDRHYNGGPKDGIPDEAGKQSWMQREARLEETIRELQNEKDSCIQSLAYLEEKIIQLQNEKDSWLQKEVTLEENIKQLLNEKTAWTLKGASLEDKIKHLEEDKNSWILKENSINERIARLNEDNIGLRTHVVELEESNGNLLQENHRLMDTVSALQSQIQGLGRENFSASTATEMAKYVSGDEDLNPQLEVARALPHVEKLNMENDELVQKVNELYVELDQRSETTRDSSMTGYDPAVVMAETATVGDHMPEYSEKISVSGDRMDPPGSTQTEHKRAKVDEADSAVNAVHKEESPGSYEAGEYEEIVQVPLDVNEVEELEMHAAETDRRREGVPLSDAPLIGAPFRLISFFAKYVSGADLVNKNHSNSNR